MTDTLHISNFKCFALCDVPTSRLNVLCGRNGAGKSSVLQALLLYRAAATRPSDAQQVALNGQAGLALGTVLDVLHHGPGRTGNDSTIIEISYGHSDDPSELLLFDTSGQDEDDNFLVVRSRPPATRLSDPSPWAFVYLSAERLGPRLHAEQLSYLPDERLGLGEYGQHAAEVLTVFERIKIAEQRLHPSERSKPPEQRNTLLLKTLEDWMSSIFGPLQIRADSNGPHAPPSILIREHDRAAEWVVATNIGFGISYCLPIVVAGLLMAENGILIVDSPEAHLHPAAQTALALFLAQVAASGCTIFVETHSDHMVDGVRLAVVLDDIDLAHGDCRFLSFARDERGLVDPQAILIGSDGKLSSWPAGFFDQQTKNLRQLAAARRK